MNVHLELSRVPVVARAVERTTIGNDDIRKMLDVGLVEEAASKNR